MKRWMLLVFAAGCSAAAPEGARKDTVDATSPAPPSPIAGTYGAGITGAWRSYELREDGSWTSQNGCCTGLLAGS